MNKKLILMVVAGLLLVASTPRPARAQDYGIPFIGGAPEDPISPPLLNSTDLGAAPVPSKEIAPGSSDLLTPTVHINPFDPLGSSLESTKLSPYIHDESVSLAPGAIDTLVPDAVFTARNSQLAAVAAAEAPKDFSLSQGSSWQIQPASRTPLPGSTAQRSFPEDNTLAGGTSTGLLSSGSAALYKPGGRLSPITGSTWEPPTDAEAQPASSAWIAGKKVSPTRLRSVVSGSPMAPEDALARQDMQAGISTEPAPAFVRRTTHQPGALTPPDYFASTTGQVGQPGQMGDFQDSTSGSAYAPQTNSTVHSRLLWNRAAGTSAAPSFPDLSTYSFLSPTLTPPLLSGNSLSEVGTNTLEQERRGLTGLNSAQQRLQMRSGSSIDQSELPRDRTRLERDQRNRHSHYKNKILEQMDRQSNADQ